MHRRILLKQLLPFGRALDDHFLDMQQLGVRTFGARFDDREIVNSDALAFHQFGGADADVQARVVCGDF